MACSERSLPEIFCCVFGGPQVAFGLVGGGRDAQISCEAEHVLLAVAQALQQLPAGPLLALAGLCHLAEAEDDPAPEGVDQWRCDLIQDGWQALVAGGVRGVDVASGHRPP